MRDHQPVVIEEFMGLYLRGSADSVPPDHFVDCNNVQFTESGVKTRDGVNILAGIPNIVRVYNYQKTDSESLLVLDTSGSIWDTEFPAVPILSVAGMTDFGFVSINGRAYISPCNGERGLNGEFLYVYLGDGTPARKAAGNPPTDADGMLAAANSATAGNVEAGFHIFAVVYETDTGFLSAPGPDTFATLTATGGFSVDLSNIPVSPSPAVIGRRIVATRVIVGYNGNQKGYQFYFVPGGTINDNTTTTLTVSFFDSELLDDASHLIDIFSEIPAFVGLGTYHNRLVGYGSFQDPKVVRVSEAGEPEAINQIDGLIILPIGGNSFSDSGAVTNARELRDILYIFDNVRTFAASDNGDVPSSWPLSILDQGLGCSVHGIATVLDTGGSNVDYLIVTNYSGIWLFNGTFNLPELSWKINSFWKGLNFSDFLNIQIMNDSIGKVLYSVLPDREVMMIGDYNVALNPEKIRWGFWTFDVFISSIALTQFNQLVLASPGTL